MRNPKWHRDEIILALDLYYRLEPGQIHARNPEIIALSELFNKLPIHDEIPNSSKFRNTNGVALKLSNFLAIDPDYHGKGMESYSKLDKVIFDEFKDDKAKLRKIASQINETISNTQLSLQLYKIDDDENTPTVKEGSIVYKLHKYKERNQSIIRKKKEQYLKIHSKLSCEICSFDFYKAYGEIGYGFIECHHIKALSELDGETLTKLEDLILVCPNCHRMLHRNIGVITIEKLKEIINTFKKPT